MKLPEAMGRLRALFEAHLAARAETWDWPEPLQSAARWALFGGGKRVRPCLALMAAEALGSASEPALPWASAVELVHTYSLVHDDLPCMDDDDLRRGRATVHVKWDEATAVLAGDALLTRAFAELDGQPGGLVALLAERAGGRGMVGGQVHDISGDLATLEALEEMQRLKTGALIAAALEGAALSVGASAEQVARLARYGRAVGLLFQITDDILDREQDAEREDNNFFHHLSEEAVYARRDAVLGTALGALEGLPEPAALAATARYIAQREV